MYRIVPKLILYGDMPKDSILMRLSEIIKDSESENFDKDDLVPRIYREVRRIISIADENGFDGNLWHGYLSYLIIMNENPFSLGCERFGKRDGSINFFAENDFALFRELFKYNFSDIEEKLCIDCFSRIADYRAVEKPDFMYNKNVGKAVNHLSNALSKCLSNKEFFDVSTVFYRDFGVGVFGLFRSFKTSRNERGEIVFTPVTNTGNVVLSDIVGYEIQKAKLVSNTAAFIEGKKANNVLLYGDSGTGKSTSIKAVVNEFYDRGLRMIQVYKNEICDLAEIVSKIKSRNYKFIIYMDDLSFEDFETDYKFLKAIIEGGAETKPENVLIYATSNRRHLIKEFKNDDADADVDSDRHSSDTTEEKLSLAYRFGITINYSRPSREEFFNIVKELAAKNGIEKDPADLSNLAFMWQAAHGGISGRTAEQFINYLAGKSE